MQPDMVEAQGRRNRPPGLERPETPESSPEPDPEPEPTPEQEDPEEPEEPQPEPTPSTQPQPEPSPTPPPQEPTPIVNPRPSPTANPRPSPQPSPVSSPQPSPVPSPSPAPEETEEPDDSDDDEGIGGIIQESSGNTPPQAPIPEPELATEPEEILNSEIALSEESAAALEEALNPNVQNESIQLPEGINSFSLQSKYNYEHGLPTAVNRVLFVISLKSLLVAAYLGRREILQRFRDFQQNLLQFG